MAHAEGSWQAYEHRRKASVSKGKWTEEWAAQIEEKLHETWSPEQIVERFRQEGRSIVCCKTVYRWIYEGRLVNVSEAQTLLRSRRRTSSMPSTSSIPSTKMFSMENRSRIIYRSSVALGMTIRQIQIALVYDLLD
ncbi:UNVERIFIED_CONTAM: IS30 family transposase [Paenibacillus sp. PvR008]